MVQRHCCGRASPELPEPQTMIRQLLAQVPEENLAGLCDHQTVEEAAS